MTAEKHMSISLKDVEFTELEFLKGMYVCGFYVSKSKKYFEILTSQEKIKFIVSISVTHSVEGEYRLIGFGVSWEEVNKLMDSYR